MIKKRLISFIYRYYLDKPKPDEIISPFEFEWEEFLKAKIIVPQIGMKKKLLFLTGGKR